MRNLLKLLSIFSIAILFALASCEGPMGLQGEPGLDGKDGIDGVDANESCTQCHNENAVVETRIAQWETSVHATGGNAGYANRSGCVQCHTSQGFLEAVAEGSTASISIPTEPQQINCYTCHKIHDTFTASDWALTKPGAQVLDVKYAGADVTWNKQGSNQCVQCHQARPISSPPVLNGPDYTITSSGTRIGPHHSPTPNLILGKDAYEIPGTAFPTTNPHSTANGCLSCHMATPYGYTGGGHSFNMKYDRHGTETLLATGCLVCHTTYTDATIAAKMATLQGEVETKLASLQAKLLAAGIYNETTGLASPGTYKANIVLAYINFITIEEDRSEGMHNPGYTKILLDNAIAKMVAEGY